MHLPLTPPPAPLPTLPLPEAGSGEDDERPKKKLKTTPVQEGVQDDVQAKGAAGVAPLVAEVVGGPTGSAGSEAGSGSPSTPPLRSPATTRPRQQVSGVQMAVAAKQSPRTPEGPPPEFPTEAPPCPHMLHLQRFSFHTVVFPKTLYPYRALLLWHKGPCMVQCRAVPRCAAPCSIPGVRASCRPRRRVFVVVTSLSSPRLRDLVAVASSSVSSAAALPRHRELVVVVASSP